MVEVARTRSDAGAGSGRSRRVIALERHYRCQSCGCEQRSWSRLSTCPDCGAELLRAVIRRAAVA